jgi:23S rRNA (pseudouridine1915-N3)-methyltransferase
MRPTIRIIAVGKLKETFFKDACSDYATRLGNMVAKLDVIEVADEPTPDGASVAEEGIIRQREAVRILAKIGDRDYVIACDLAGKQLDSPALAQHFMDASTFQSASTFTIVVGGSLGLDDSVLVRSNFRWCFGKLTLPHQLARVIALEQTYRAFKILRGEPYHK